MSMNKQRYIDYDLIEQYPNKYNITPNGIKRLRVLDWDKLKEETWFNKATTPNLWCKLIGCQKENEKYDDYDEFWIGFAENGDVNHHFTTYEGMCSYDFKKFYQMKSIENKYDMQLQVNTIKWLNEMIDKGILGYERLPGKKKKE